MFDYFAVLVSVIFGLALTHILRGFGRILQLRGRCRIYVPHMIWTIGVAQWVLAAWWGMFWWRNLSDWTFAGFLFIAVYSTCFFLWSYMLYPHEIPEGMDFEESFFQDRQPFFALLLVCALVDIPEVLVKAPLGLRAVPGGYPLVIGIPIVIAIVGLVSANRRVHRWLPVVFVAHTLGYEALTLAGHMVAAR